MTAFTARELRIIADHLETLTKARTANEHLGVPTTPDVFTARFHTGLVAVLRWRPGIASSEPGKQRYIQSTARHRDSYQIDLGATPDTANALALKDPWKVKREQRARKAGVVLDINLQGGEQAVKDIAREHVRRTPGA
ncbi:hypothetical protein B0E38_06485 [Streptomyces sp. 111WW2]|uniref:hypothetical protein n=1 Tax=Streptomyces sp. 111WW2 TaxID=1945515 RepID=UPI000D0C8CCB|nr:hypothetical protein [Streptomyces sp. 111WW2]PSK48008.1 hypothetical protein B0E38_06485 [Streptomyces sp. 111WW2]